MFVLEAYPQRQADKWYFSLHCGLDFSSGSPIVLHDGRVYSQFGGAGTICDSIGNLLFYSINDTVYTHLHTIMENGTNFPYTSGTQSSLIVPWPESDSLYYLFKIPHIGSSWGLTYNVVDITKNNGLGSVIEKNIDLGNTFDAADKITVALHKNRRDIWLITRKYIYNKFAVFLITPEGISEEPDLYDAMSIPVTDLERGYMKVSYDKKYLFTSNEDERVVEVCSFNHENGEIEFLFALENGNRPMCLEFSPDSKFAYISYTPNTPNMPYEIRQFNMENISIPWLFLQSSQIIGTGYGHGLQLATDGKIYCMGSRYNSPDHFIGVIHNPWELGTSCSFEFEAINLFPGELSRSSPNILMDYLYRFEFDGICESDTFTFKSNFNPIPDSIRWHFNDFLSGASNISYEINPTHKFSDGGEYEVEADVWYPTGRFEHTSRVVKVEYSPEPELGPDTTFCSTSGITLDAECGPHFYLWSNGAFGSSQIIVSDTGWYWVNVENDAGCFEIDSIHISFHNTAFADTTNLVISPTTCGGSTGAIKGLLINGAGPLSYRWLDDLGNPISTSPDIYHLPVGNYTLEVTDSNDCVNYFGPYSIHDAGDVLIEGVTFSQEHCNQQDASIIIHAISGLSDMLFYSIDNGANYFTNEGIFTGLSAGNYAVRVKDSSDCQDVYINNPVIIQNTDAPEITDLQIGACSSGQSNGSIEITAIGGGDTLYYSNDNGVNFQVNDGGFYDLLAGFYTCVVMDEAGCDTTFVVEVPEEITLRLQAVAGEDEICPGNTAFVPLYVSNFNDVAYFKTTLLYDQSLLGCTGYANTHAQIEDSLEVMLFPAEGKVELFWHAPSVSLPDNTVLTDLVFESLDPGLSMVAWDGSAGASQFLNPTGLTIPADYYLGSVRIYQEVLFSPGPDIEACQGDDIQISPVLWSSNGEVSYLWSDPSGSTSTNEILSISNAQPTHSGIWSLRITDTLDCYSEDSVEITIHPTPVPAFAGQDTITTEEPVEIDAGDGFAGYLWNTGETSQLITAETEDWYSVMIESLYGCAGEDSVYVQFVTAPPPPPPPEEPPGERILLPNAFTPDGDGLNDEFKAMGQPDNLSSFSMTIFNRWGQMVFESKDVLFGWDGTIKGAEAPAGTYVFRVDYSIAGYDFDTKGTVVLVR